MRKLCGGIVKSYSNAMMDGQTLLEKHAIPWETVLRFCMISDIWQGYCYFFCLPEHNSPRIRSVLAKVSEKKSPFSNLAAPIKKSSSGSFVKLTRLSLPHFLFSSFFPFVFAVLFSAERLVRCCGVGEGVFWHSHRALLKEADWHLLEPCQSSSGEIPTAVVGVWVCKQEIDRTGRERERHYGKVKGGGWRVVERENTRFAVPELLWMLVMLACSWLGSLYSSLFVTLFFHSSLDWAAVCSSAARRHEGMKDKKRVAPYFRFSNLLRIPRFYSSAHSCLHHSLWNSFVLQFLPSLFGNVFFFFFSFQFLPRRN